VLDTQRYDGQEHRYIDYTVPDMLQMMGRASLLKRISIRSSSLNPCHLSLRYLPMSLIILMLRSSQKLLRLNKIALIGLHGVSYIVV
jgi:hypothetical protein